MSSLQDKTHLYLQRNAIIQLAGVAVLLAELDRPNVGQSLKGNRAAIATFL
jgi:hypothetical protein